MHLWVLVQALRSLKVDANWPYPWVYNMWLMTLHAICRHIMSLPVNSQWQSAVVSILQDWRDLHVEPKETTVTVKVHWCCSKSPFLLTLPLPKSTFIFRICTSYMPLYTAIGVLMYTLMQLCHNPSHAYVIAHAQRVECSAVLQLWAR